MLIGRFEHTIDAKNRLNIPSKLRKHFTEDGCIMVKGLANCIEIYPMDQWNKVIMPKLEKLDPFKPDHAQAKRRYLFYATEEATDTQYRLLIPQNLLDEVGIKKDVLLLGTIDKVEVWDPDKYREYINQQPLTFEEVTEKVMTNL